MMPIVAGRTRWCLVWRGGYGSRLASKRFADGQRLVHPARRLADNGLDAWAQVLKRGYEGMVGKDDASPYREGRTLWLKVKQPRYREGERGWEAKT